MKTNSVLCFAVTAERERRFTVSPAVVREALEKEYIKISDIIAIEQVWIINDEKCSGRIRKARDLLLKEDLVLHERYEHTVKYHIDKTLDYEVTTDISENDYNLLKKLYKEIKPQCKNRVYVVDPSGKYENYIITIDYPDDKPEECWVEFELKDGRISKEFKKPEWLVEKN